VKLENDIKKFLTEHNACKEGIDWALNNCKDMAEVWDKCNHGLLMFLIRIDGLLTKRQLRIFSVRCVWNTPTKNGRVYDLLKDERSKNALRTAYKFAYGISTKEELSSSANSAYAVSSKFNSSAAYDYASYASSAAYSVASSAFVAATTSSVAVAVSSGDRSKAYKWQDEMLRRTIKNPWSLN
jgi:hypothetical protein